MNEKTSEPAPEHVTDETLEKPGTCPDCGADIVVYADVTGLLPDEVHGDRRAVHSWLVCQLRAELRALRARPATNDRAKLDVALYDPDTAEGAAALLDIMGPPSAGPRVVGMSDEKWAEIRQYLLDGRWLTKANARLLVQHVEATRALRAPVAVEGEALRLAWACATVFDGWTWETPRDIREGHRMPDAKDVPAQLLSSLTSHVQRAAVLAREAEGLRAEVATLHRQLAAEEAQRDGALRCVRENGDELRIAREKLNAARAEIERLTRERDAWKGAIAGGIKAALAIPADDLGAAEWGDSGCSSWDDLRDDHEAADEEERAGTQYRMICDGAERVRARVLAVFGVP